MVPLIWMRLSWTVYPENWNTPVIGSSRDRGGSDAQPVIQTGVMMSEIRKMAKLAGVEGIENTADQAEYDEFVGDATEKWAMEGEGYSLLKGSVVYLRELKRYCYKRNPHNKYNKFIGSLNSIIRHLDGLIMGSHVYENEIDQFTFLQYANIRAKCEWLKTIPDTTRVRISLTSIMGADVAYSGFLGRLPPLDINGREPKNFLNGKCLYDIFKSKNDVNLIPVTTKEM